MLEKWLDRSGCFSILAQAGFAIATCGRTAALLSASRVRCSCSAHQTTVASLFIFRNLDHGCMLFRGRERNKRGIFRKILKRGTIVSRTTTSTAAGLQWSQGTTALSLLQLTAHVCPYLEILALFTLGLASSDNSYQISPAGRASLFTSDLTDRFKCVSLRDFSRNLTEGF